ncbi:MAG: ribonuclease HIII [Armatimonadetes bacterium]|nr:ribonuclease HIII [Armatimonadota bacterium]
MTGSGAAATPRIGVEEGGKGDFFGPLVVAACYVGPEQETALSGVKDGKKLKDEACLEWDALVRKSCPHAIIVIGPSKYNELYEKVRNLNALLAWGHARAIENLLDQVACETVVSARISDAHGVAKALAARGKTVRFSVPHEEGDPAVAAASVLARAEFIRGLRSLSETFGGFLPKGANRNAVEAGAKIVGTGGKTALKDVAKLHFKTLQEVLKLARTSAQNN